MGDIKLENVEVEIVEGKKTLTTDFSKLGIDEKTKEVETSFDNDPTKALRDIFNRRKEKDPSAKCPSCGGKPQGSKPCVICGQYYQLVKTREVLDIPDEKSERLFIPQKYKGKVFSSDKLIKSHEDLLHKKKFTDFANGLGNLINRAMKGYTEPSSLYISAPSGFGKEHFAYSLLQVGLANNVTVFPYLDLMEVSRLITAYEEGDMKNPIIQDIGFSDIELYNAKICVLKVPHNNVNVNNYKVMLQIIDRRARRGLPTIFLSRYNIKYFTSMDYSREVEGIIDYNNPSPKNLQVYEYDGK